MQGGVTAARHDHPFLPEGSRMAELIAGHGWPRAFGPPAEWTAELKAAVGLIMRSGFPMFLIWGSDRAFIYNDAYAPILGSRHPQALGRPFLEVWPEVRDQIGPIIEQAFEGRQSFFEDLEVDLAPQGGREGAWFTFSYGPIVDAEGRIPGVLCTCVETTKAVLGRKAQQEERERQRALFERAPGFICILRGPDHVFEFVNKTYRELFGERDFIGRTVAEVFPEIAGQGFPELLDAVYRTGERHVAQATPIAIEAPGAPPALRFVDFVYEPVHDADGQVSGIFCEGFDATAAHRSRQAMAESEARNRQILDSVIDYAIIAVDLEGRVTRWNAGAEHILGWSEAEMLGQDIARFFTREDIAAGRPELERTLARASGHASNTGWRLRRSGERFWATGEMILLRDEAGEAAGFVKVLRDRTAEHRAEEALLQSTAQLRRAQEAGGVGVFTIDLDRDVIHGTPEFCRIFGLERADEIGAEVIEGLVIPEDSEVVSNATRRRKGAAALDVEYRIVRPDTGEERTIARKGEYERDASGRPVRLLGVVQDVTESRRVQRELAQSEAQFRTLAQAMPSQVWTATPDGRLDWFNAQVYAYTGAGPGELDGDGWTRYLHPDDMDPLVARWQACVASGETYQTEFRLRGPGGEYRWQLARALPIRDARQGITHWVGTNTDIHERRIAEDATARDRQRMWRMSQDLMLVSDRTGLITAVNPTSERLLGWTEQEMTGRRLTDFLHPDDIEACADRIAAFNRGAPMLAFESRYRTRDGSYRLLAWTAVPDGDRIHGVARDVTEARAAARDQERIWTLSPVLKFVASDGGDITKVNPAWTQVLGWTAEETAGRNIAELAAPEQQQAARAMVAEAAASAAAADHHLPLSAKDGGVRQIDWTLIVEGGILYGFGRDVTEQRAAEDALRQSQKMEAVGQLTGGIAHDFNNLLQGITGSLDLVQKRIGQGRLSELDRFISGAMNSANRASALTHRLLAFSRRQPLDPRPVRANPLVSSMEDLLRRTLGEGIELELVLSGGLWTTRCDPNQLESAILNLAINARDAMPDGGVLTIETSNAHLDRAYAARQRDVRPGQYVCISVTDTGTGMSPETVARAFEPFFTTKPIGQGTGLGLSMIYGFAKQSEGYAKIYSEVGQGTTFKLYLPRHRGEAEDEEALPRLSGIHHADDGETVLVVEDEPVVRGLIVEILSDLGYHAIEAADGQQGLEVLQSRRRIDLLVTDIGLPGLNGRQLADAGRSLRAGLKVLFMTGYAENAALASGFLEPGMAMITKPFAMELFATRVREILENARG